MNMKTSIERHAFKAIAAVCLVLGGCFGGGGSERCHNSEFTHGNMKWHLEKNKTHESEVLEVFGPPNVTSIDSEGLEMWVYQKMSTSKIYNAFGSSLNLSALLNEVTGNIAGGVPGLGGLNGNVSVKGNVGGSGGMQYGRHSSTQSSKTCTMILKFDDHGILVEYKFRTSNF